MSLPHPHTLDRCRTGGIREPVNGWFHFAGALLAVAALVVLVAEALERGQARHVIGAAVFGITALGMFSASALYHLRRTSPRQRLYQRLDHAMIYVFIAGTYTPVCLLALWPGLTGQLLLAFVWAIALAGLMLDVVGRPLTRGQATAFYLAMGWCAFPLIPALGAHPRLAAWLLVGGILYTGGAILYWRQVPRRRLAGIGFHEIWHLCVLAASASHFWAIRTYALAL
jgi:hemolysin III